ncbi:MAG TPA: hypothetical protein VKD72_26685 [Gemmataceae bacterium]|nr:hypothetical protein [Gemmataceae bacterium]
MLTITSGTVERIDKASNTRKELSAEEYAAVAASYYATYYMGVRDYAQAVASGNVELVQAYTRERSRSSA